jgi:signal recognition particle subunit SRP54
MVLGSLGGNITRALHSIFTTPVIDEKTLDDALKDVCKALLEADVNVKLVQTLRKNVKEAVNLKQLPPGVNKQRIIHRALMDEMCRLIDPGVTAFTPQRGKSNIILFVGLQGSGKTTSLSKLASWYHRKGWKVAMVAGDTFRAGAFDQLKQNAIKAQVPFYGDPGEDDPVKVVTEGVDRFRKAGFEIILVDSSGRHRQEEALFEEMKLLSKAANPDQVILVMDANIGQTADSQARAFSSTVTIGSIILTKMDSEAKGGGALSAVAATGAPIIFIGTGEHLHDIEPFQVRPFVSKMLGMGDLRGLVDTMKQLDLEKDHAELAQRLEKGIFTLKDMKEQFLMFQKLGPLKSIMGMIPGFSSEMFAGDDAQSRLKRMTIIMDSMCHSELESDGKCFTLQPNRVKRVAKGSGSATEMVEFLLLQYRNFAKFIKQMGGETGLMNMISSGAKGNTANANALKNMLPPQMLNQMGGLGGLSNIMQQFSSLMNGGASDDQASSPSDGSSAKPKRLTAQAQQARKSKKK